MAADLSHDLSQFLAAAGRRGFCWGRHDCMLFAADWAREVCGADPAQAWRGSYHDKAGALAVLENEGGAASIMAQGLEPYGWRRVDAATARPGDIVLAAPPHHPGTAGLAAGRGRVALLTRCGLMFWPVPIITAWRHG